MISSFQAATAWPRESSRTARCILRTSMLRCAMSGICMKPTSEGLDYFLANSRNVAAKIQKLYGRQATVIHPPVDLEKFHLGGRVESYYLIVSALVPYKRIDIAIRAFNQMRLPLKVV